VLSATLHYIGLHDLTVEEINTTHCRPVKRIKQGIKVSRHTAKQVMS